MRLLGVIPARYASTRFPGKPLVKIGDRTMIHRTYDQALKSSLDAVVVATDDPRIFDEVLGFGGQAVMTRSDHRSGTDRCREALEKVEKGAGLASPGAGLAGPGFGAGLNGTGFGAGLSGTGFGAVVNIQGDEPFIDPSMIDQVAELLRRGDTPLATLARKIADPALLANPNVVKVVFDCQGNALYFSRHPIPFVRGAEPSEWLGKADYYQHLGLYGYTAEALKAVTALGAGRLETAESLEQLRWLENGFRLKVAVTTLPESVSIDTPDDLLKLPKFWLS